MTGSYKVALGASLVLFLIVVTYYMLQGSGQPDRPVVDQTPGTTQEPEQREAPPGSLADLTRRPEPRPTSNTTRTADAGETRSQADLLRERLMASQSAANRTPTQAAPDTATPSTTTAASPAGSATGTATNSGPQTGSPAPDRTTPPPLPWPDRTADAQRTETTTNTTATRPAVSEPRTTATTTPPTPAAQRTYTVQAGDTLSSIATQVYGSERAWVDIAQANPTIDPIRLKVGQVLRLPSQQAIRQSEEPAAAAPGQVVSYTVRSGDTLSSIAQQYYGDPSQWRYIFNANRDKLGSNPDAIRAGMQITVPPSPRAAE